MSPGRGVVRKPKALRKGCTLAFFAAASPPNDDSEFRPGLVELNRLGFGVVQAHEIIPNGYFAGSSEARSEGFLSALKDKTISGLISSRGGYGSTYLLDRLQNEDLGIAKCVIGFSDLTALQTFLWQRDGWITFQGPMVLSGFAGGANSVGGYDAESFLNSVTKTDGTWSLNLQGECLRPGTAEGRILGGCLTLLQTSMGTPWEMDTEGAVLLLEDTHMKPYQVDRALMHLKQAGKLKSIRGIVLGEFPNSEPPVKGSPTVRSVCERILGALGVPIVFGAPIGHTKRAMLTVPVGVRARLNGAGDGTLEILEPAVVD
jgi:muramoyltetrapeptide carboxypeptidase